MTPTTEQVRQAAQQAVSAQPDADIRTQTMAALDTLGIHPYSQAEYERVKAHVKRLRNPKPQHGGARENSGRPVTGEAHLYIGTVTATGKDGDLAQKLLSGYGMWLPDDRQWLVALTPPQARYIIQRHGDKLTLERNES